MELIEKSVTSDRSEDANKENVLRRALFQGILRDKDAHAGSVVQNGVIKHVPE